MIGLEQEDRGGIPHDAPSAPSDRARTPEHDDIEDVWDDEDYEDWLFL